MGLGASKKDYQPLGLWVWGSGHGNEFKWFEKTLGMSRKWGLFQ